MKREREAMTKAFPAPVDKRRISRRTLLKRAAFTTAGICAIDTFFVEPRWPQVVSTQVALRDLGKEFDGFRIGILSDFHYDNHISSDFIKHCLHLVGQELPDVLLFLGDYVHSKKYFGDELTELPNIRSVFSEIPKTEHGAFGVLGNHDHWFDAKGVRTQLAETPINLIDNQVVLLKRGKSRLALVGTADFWEETITFARTFSALPPGIPTILLQHNPDLAEVCPPQYRVDLQVSGHTHGGQVKVPFGPALILPSKFGNKYRAGLIEGPRYPVYVTRGIGVSGPVAVRFNCRPEITVLSLVAG